MAPLCYVSQANKNVQIVIVMICCFEGKLVNHKMRGGRTFTVNVLHAFYDESAFVLG
jgi:hypothetical protein